MRSEGTSWNAAGSAEPLPAKRVPWRAPAWRRLAAIVIAIGALEPLALTRQSSNGGDGGDVGGVSLNWHGAVYRPVAVFALTAGVLWIWAAALWSARSWRLTTATGFSAAAAVLACVVALATTEQGRTAPISRTELSLIHRGEREAAVVASLGPAPYEGSTSPPDPGESIPCLVYNANLLGPEGSSGPQPSGFGPEPLCFKDGRLALKGSA